VCVLTIAAGVASLLVFEGFNDGAMWTYQERVVHSRLGHIQIAKRVKEGTLSTDVKESLIPQFQSIREKMKNPELGVRLQNTYPRMQLSGLITNNIRTVPVMAEGIDPEVENSFFYEMEYITGHALDPKASDGVILGKGVADALGVKVGDRVTLLAYTLQGSLNASDLIVTGTFSGGVQQFDESYIRLPLKTAQDLLQTEGVTTISVGLLNSDFTQADLLKINSILPADLEARSFDVIDNVYYGNAMRWLKAQFFFIRMIIFMIVILGILNTVNITIHERTSEIGTLRAMGFSKHFIKWQFLREYAFLGLAGAILGLIFAYVVDKLFLYQGFPMPPSPGATKGLQVHLQISEFAILVNMSLAVVLSMISTYWPAKKGSQLSIVEALGYKI
jgi:putative ABC transport system permease protein